jgi:EmrB/QacA subfamily drug resistance transporter
VARPIFEDEMDGPAAPAASRPLAPADIRSILLGLMTAQLLAALDSTIVGPAMPTIGRDLGNLDLLPWIITIYLLVSTALTPLYGKLADIHGRRIVLLFAVSMFLLGSIACALSRNMLMLILARGLQGIGGGGIFSLAQTIMGDIVAPRDRARYQVYTSGVWMLANLAGPAIGGVFTEHLHWSMIFWINLPLGLAALVITNTKLKLVPRHERPHALDIIGAGLIIVASVLLMLALSWGGARAPWLSLPILGLFAASAVFWVLFIGRLLTAAEPLIPLSILANPTVMAGTFTQFFAVGSYLGLSIYIPVYFQVVTGLSVSASGVAVIPFLVFSTLGATIAARLMSRLEHYARVPLVGVAMAALGTALLFLMPRDTPFVAFEAALIVISTGIGTLFPVLNVAIQVAVPLHALGTTMALLIFLRSLGAAMAVALFGTIALGAVAAGHGGPASGGIQSGVDIAAAADDFGKMFLVAAISLAVGLVCLLFMGERPLPKHQG